MAYSEGQLNGAADYRVGINIWLSSQNAGGNYSTFSWEVHLTKGSGASAWANSTQYGSANIGGNIYNFTFTMPESERFNPDRILYSGATDIGHAADGTRPGFASSAYLDTDHSNVGDGGSGGAWVDAPSFVRIPGAPNVYAASNITYNSIGFSYTRGAANGSGIDQDEVQWSPNSSFSPVVWTDTGANGYTSPQGGATPGSPAGGLASGQMYYVRVRSHNAQGWSGWSNTGAAKTLLPAPALTSWTQDASGALVAKWTAPATTTGLTGYRLQVARDSGFTVGVLSIDVGNVLTRAVTALVGGRQYWVRVVARTADGEQTYSSSLNTTLILATGDLDGWTRVGTKPANIAYFTTEGIRRGTVGVAQALFLESLSTGAATLATNTFGMQRMVTGLTPGKAYRLQMTAQLTDAATPGDVYRLAVDATNGTTVTVTTAPTTMPPLEFVATSTIHYIKVLLAEPLAVASAQDLVERVAFSGVKFLELDTDYPERLRATVYESTLVNHLDLATNSVGATWYVAKDGVTRFRLPGESLPVSAIFSDENTVGAASYIDITAGYDTRSTVNRIEATNYGMDGFGVNEENDSLIVNDLASQAQYGIYRTTLNLNLHDTAPYDGSFADRLAELLDAHNEPAAAVTGLRWNAQEDMALANALEVGQRITVRYRGLDYDSQIVSIQHDLQPTRWIIALTLNPL